MFFDYSPHWEKSKPDSVLRWPSIYAFDFVTPRAAYVTFGSCYGWDSQRFTALAFLKQETAKVRHCGSQSMSFHVLCLIAFAHRPPGVTAQGLHPNPLLYVVWTFLPQLTSEAAILSPSMLIISFGVITARIALYKISL